MVHSVSESIFQLDKGFLYTAKVLLLRPKESLTGFFNGKRKRLFKPFGFLIVSATIFLIVTKFFGNGTFVNDALDGFKEGFNNQPEETFDTSLFDLLLKNQTYIYLFIVPVFSIASFLSFRKSRYNFSEHLVLNLFVTGEQLLIYTLFSFISDRDGVIILLPLGLGFFYVIWVYNRFFNKIHWLRRNLNLLLTYIIYLTLMMSLFMLLILIIIISNN